MGLGSNIGDHIGHLRAARAGLGALGDVVAASSIWETAPIGPDQPDYLNAVVVLDTVIGPMPLLDACRDLERAAGRERRERWGPRSLDLDVLIYGDAMLQDERLVVPHPRMHARRFVLEPLAEAWPDAVIPGRGPVGDLLAAVGVQDVERSRLAW